MSSRFLVVGAGFSGAVIARELAEQLPCHVVVIDQREHVAGNCHTERDAKTGVMVHRYGPHIFNTDNEAVWSYMNRFGEMRLFTNRVKAITPKGLFSLPVNLLTINQYFDQQMSPQEAEDFIRGLGDSSIKEPANFEEQALKMLGRELYENFFYGYTLKQWGCEPSELPASILKRLPVRFNYNDSYYDKKYQAIPEGGYSAIVQSVLNHQNIELKLGVSFEHEMLQAFDHVFYTGPIDAFFEYNQGRLGYRTVEFERIDAEGDYQGNPVINYTSAKVPYTRIHEHKHFAPWEEHEKTVAFREFSKETGSSDIPYYPKRLAADMEKLKQYQTQAEQLSGVTFLGRLATYRYMDMEKVIGEALEFAGHHFKHDSPISDWPTFPSDSSHL